MSEITPETERRMSAEFSTAFSAYVGGPMLASAKIWLLLLMLPGVYLLYREYRAGRVRGWWLWLLPATVVPVCALNLIAPGLMDACRPYLAFPIAVMAFLGWRKLRYLRPPEPPIKWES